MRQKLLLLEDVQGLGRSGDVVVPKAGFTRNFLLPQKKALLADKHTLKIQAKLKEERAKQAAVDRKEAEKLALQFAGVLIEHEVKVDPDGKMYGSVTQIEIMRLIQDAGYAIERRHVTIPHPIKTLGLHTIPLKLNEGVPATIKLSVIPEGGALSVKEEIIEVQAADTPVE
ncbi:MAG: 50S ribosomal protein L9 [Chlamydiales bacterium]